MDASGVPRVGARLFFYQAGTTTPQATFADPGLTIANTNPVVADEAGQFGDIFLLDDPAYAVVLDDAEGNQVWAMDPVGVGTGGTGTLPVGAIMDFAGAAAPPGWLLCYGQTVGRTTYAALFAAIGTIFGPGDGATTFGLPDLRGRATFGVDNMGGAAANRLTMAGSGVNAVVPGAVGGDQNAPAHTHVLTDPGHDHALNDPGHTHEYGYQTMRDSGTDTAHYYAYSYTQGGTNWQTSQSTTGIVIDSATSGITISGSGTGAAANVPPAICLNRIIYTGVGG
ncbi:hypothetical protein AA13595_2891 [Gluconacetobacter johannae DSM 13595]|nr:hypothetical protein AA13595_2891 [Gluconacetobacter johannae DSM 13595]